MRKIGKVPLGFVLGTVLGGLTGLVWGWLVIARGAGGIDYPEMEMLTRTAVFMGLIDGITGMLLARGRMSTKSARSLFVGLTFRFLLAWILPYFDYTDGQRDFVVGCAAFCPLLAGLLLGREG